MKKILIIIFIFLFFIITCEIQDESKKKNSLKNWTRRLGGEGDEGANSLIIDNSGNIIVSGCYGGSADLNGDGDTADGISETGFYIYDETDTFLIKYSNSGIYLWSKRIGGVNHDFSETPGVVVTDSSSNIILTGRVLDNADLNGDGDMLDDHETAGVIYDNFDMFITKFDPSGNPLWSKRLGGLYSDSGRGITIDSENNIYLTGYITGDADLNGDGDTTDGDETASGIHAFEDIFIIKLTALGNIQWIRRLGGNNSDSGNSISIDFDGNILVTGYITGDADLNSDGDTNDTDETESGIDGSKDIFIVKYNSNGGFLMSKRLGGTADDEGRKIVIDNNNNIYLAGIITGAVDLNDDGDSVSNKAETIMPIHGSYDILTVKYNQGMNHIWSKRLGGINNDNIYDITLKNNLIYIAGSINNIADFNFDWDTDDEKETPSIINGSVDGFFAVFDLDGEFQEVNRIGGKRTDTIKGIKIDSNNRICITGYINDEVDLNEDGDCVDPGEQPLYTNERPDIFIKIY